MERTQTIEGGGEREQREALEQVQMELRTARLALQTASSDSARAEEALRSAIVDATLRRDEAVARVQALKAQNASATRLVETLEKRLVEKEKEDAVLERGAQLRDKYVDWNPNDPLERERNKDGMTVAEVKAGALILGVGLLLFILFLLVTRR
jgi:hypothetical protein